MQLGISKEIAM